MQKRQLFKLEEVELHYNSTQMTQPRKTNTVFSVVSLSNYQKHYSLHHKNSLSYDFLGQKSNTGVIGLKSRCLQVYLPFCRLQTKIYFLYLSMYLKRTSSIAFIPPYICRARDDHLGHSQVECLPDSPASLCPS